VKDKLLKIIGVYGIDKQLKYIHSEYFELDEAIVKANYLPFKDEKDLNNIAGEIADIMVMLKQIQYYYNIKDKDIEEIMNYKINRQLERIDNEIKKERNK